ncbi:MAG: AsnC family protein, partial [Holophagales bacterium]|nr:AsnC family protein [Holophagales bacterium]
MIRSLLNDDLNRKILALLQKEGRISHAELAERLGVSRPTVIDRIKRLEN